MGSLLRFSQGQSQGVEQARFLSGGSGEESFSLIQFTGEIQFSVVIGLRSPFPCRLSARATLSF